MAKATTPAAPASDYTRLLESYFDMREEEDRLASARAALAHRLHQHRAEQKGLELGDQLGRAACRQDVAPADAARSAKPKAD